MYLQSFGCVHVGTTDNGVRNPGIMQSHNGASFIGNAASAGEQQASVTTMVVNGVQGTSNGDGLVQLINKYGNIYEVSPHTLFDRYFQSLIESSGCKTL
jgi:hypothetical protein